MKKSAYNDFGGNWKDFYNCKLPVVYCITNKLNNTLYIGISGNLPNRLRGYGAAASSNKTGIMPIYCAIKKYGTINFSFDVIKIYDNIEECKCEEIEQIAYLKQHNYRLYNASDCGDLMPPVPYKSGEDVYNAKFTYKDVETMFDMHHNQNYSVKEIADLYNSKLNNIWQIFNGQKYKKVSQYLFLKYGNIKYDSTPKYILTDHNNSNFTKPQIEKIFRLYHKDIVSTEYIANKFDSDRGTICVILAGELYKNISYKLFNSYGGLHRNTLKIDGYNRKCRVDHEDIINIIELRNKGLSDQKIGKLYKIGHSTVFSIVSGLTWKHITAGLIGDKND